MTILERLKGEQNTMTSDLDGIDHLSMAFDEAAENLPRHTFEPHSTILSEFHPIITQGEKILRMYEAEQAKAPNDLDVRYSLSRHLYRLGYLYYDAIIPQYLPRNEPVNNSDDPRAGMARNAEKSCYYMYNSFSLNPNAGAAFSLGCIFHMSRFYATAMHWYAQAENVAEDDEYDEFTIKAKARRLEMQADGRISDPPISPRSSFPTLKTPGVILENQPATPVQSTSSSQGCGGNAVLIFIIIYAIKLFFV